MNFIKIKLVAKEKLFEKTALSLSFTHDSFFIMSADP